MRKYRLIPIFPIRTNQNKQKVLPSYFEIESTTHDIQQDQFQSSIIFLLFQSHHCITAVLLVSFSNCELRHQLNSK
jgi:hypothetical protein